MKSKLSQITFLFLFFAVIGTTLAQGDLEIFGFFQTRLSRSKGHTKMVVDVPTSLGIQKINYLDNSADYLSPNVQQLNVFMRKELTDNVTAWVNIEYVNSFSSDKKWGSMEVNEAWVNYEVSNALNVKAGMLVPRFNYLNELKNKMPLLPYVIRPIIYETALTSVVNASAFLPTKAFIQLNGYLPINDMTLDYSAFCGPSENSYINSGAVQAGKETGVDTTVFKSFGGRVGIKYGNLRLGVSASYDKQNEQDTYGEDVPRTRIGSDFGFSAFNFFFDGEFIKVILNPDNTTEDLDKLFYYGTLGYNFSDSYYLACTYSVIKDQQVSYLKEGLNSGSIVFGYRPFDSLVLKAEYSGVWFDGDFKVNVGGNQLNANMDLTYETFSIAASVQF
jgi:hypothetical protein